MVREPDATMQPTPQDNPLMSKHRVLSFRPQLQLEWRGQDGQNETEQPDHSASLGDSITASTQIRFSVRTADPAPSTDTQILRRNFSGIAGDHFVADARSLDQFGTEYIGPRSSFVMKP
jgi:hypothetical protein